MRSASVILTLFVRELKGYFYSPIGYVVAGIFLFINGFFFGVTLHGRLLVSEDLFGRISILLLFITPMVSMRFLSEELRTGTIEPLATDPVRSFEIVAGKWLGGCVFMALNFVPLAVFCLFVHSLGHRHGGLDPGPVAAGLIGLLLMVAASLAVGALFSAMTRNQVVAAVLTFVVLLLLFLLDLLGPAFGGESAFLREASRYLSLSGHLFRFFRGQIAWEDVIYFSKVVLLALYLSVVVLDSRRWR